MGALHKPYAPVRQPGRAPAVGRGGYGPAPAGDGGGSSSGGWTGGGHPAAGFSPPGGPLPQPSPSGGGLVPFQSFPGGGRGTASSGLGGGGGGWPPLGDGFYGTPPQQQQHPQQPQQPPVSAPGRGFGRTRTVVVGAMGAAAVLAPMRWAAAAVAAMGSAPAAACPAGLVACRGGAWACPPAAGAVRMGGTRSHRAHWVVAGVAGCRGEGTCWRGPAGWGAMCPHSGWRGHRGGTDHHN